MRDTVLALARLLRQTARGEPVPDHEGELKRYATVLRDLGAGTDVPSELRGLELRPCFIVNGLSLAGTQEADSRAFTLDALATGLESFREYVVAITDRGAPRSEAVAGDEPRFFAWLLAQLPECGFGLDAVFLTMKADALDQGSAYAVRAIVDDGPPAVLTSELFTPSERELWKDVFAAAPGAWEALQAHLVTAHRLPFRGAWPS